MRACDSTIFIHTYTETDRHEHKKVTKKSQITNINCTCNEILYCGIIEHTAIERQHLLLLRTWITEETYITLCCVRAGADDINACRYQYIKGSHVKTHLFYQAASSDGVSGKAVMLAHLLFFSVCVCVRAHAHVPSTFGL